MSIIDDVRIKQDIDKDGKYVCDLNQKEKLEAPSDIVADIKASSPIDLDTRFTMRDDGVLVPGTNIVIPPTVYVNIAILWLQNSKKYGWKMKDLPVSYEDYISNVIAKLKGLI